MPSTAANDVGAPTRSDVLRLWSDFKVDCLLSVSSWLCFDAVLCMQVWNLRVIASPAMVAYPRTSTHVSQAVKCARQSSVKVVARSGAHSYEYAAAAEFMSMFSSNVIYVWIYVWLCRMRCQAFVSRQTDMTSRCSSAGAMRCRQAS